MADTKFSQYAALGAAPASADKFLLCDVSDTSMAATGTTKHCTFANLIAGVIPDDYTFQDRTAGNTVGFLSAVTSGGLGGGSEQELLISVHSAANAVAIRNTNAAGLPSLTFRSSANLEKMALGYGAGNWAGPDSCYIQAWNGNNVEGAAPPVFVISQDWYPTGAGEFQHIEKLLIAANGDMGFCRGFGVLSEPNALKVAMTTGHLSITPSLADNAVLLRNMNASGYDNIVFMNEGGAARMFFGHANDSAGLNPGKSSLFTYNSGATPQDFILGTFDGSGFHSRLTMTGLGNIVINEAVLATTATDGFLYVPSCAGTPTGTPTSYTGRLPIIINSTNHKLYFYSGGAWRDAGP